jgi:DNA-binding IclR family transcriptional regulator
MTETASERGASGGLQSVDRALSVLELLARWSEGGVSDLAVELGVHKSTAFRLLGALENHGMVEQTEERGKYQLGFGLVRLAGAVSSRMDLTRLVRPVLAQLATDVGETVNLAVLREHYVVNLDQALGPASVTTHNWVGELTPLHATSSGKVLLAHVDPEQQHQLLTAAGGRVMFNGRTITDPDALDREIGKVLEQGYAVAIGEYEAGLNAIAVPVRGPDGSVLAALSASGPSYRFTPERIEELASRMRDAGREASRRLGHLGD